MSDCQWMMICRPCRQQTVSSVAAQHPQSSGTVAAGSGALRESQQNYFHHHKLIPMSVLSSITWEKITHHHPHCPLSPGEDPLRAYPVAALGQNQITMPCLAPLPVQGDGDAYHVRKKSLLLPLS